MRSVFQNGTEARVRRLRNGAEPSLAGPSPPPAGLPPWPPAQVPRQSDKVRSRRREARFPADSRIALESDASGIVSRTVENQLQFGLLRSVATGSLQAGSATASPLRWPSHPARVRGAPLLPDSAQNLPGRSGRSAPPYLLVRLDAPARCTPGRFFESVCRWERHPGLEAAPPASKSRAPRAANNCPLRPARRSCCRPFGPLADTRSARDHAGRKRRKSGLAGYATQPASRLAADRCLALHGTRSRQTEDCLPADTIRPDDSAPGTRRNRLGTVHGPEASTTCPP